MASLLLLSIKLPSKGKKEERKKRGRFYQFPAILCPTVTKRNWREKHRETFYQVLVIP